VEAWAGEEEVRKVSKTPVLRPRYEVSGEDRPNYFNLTEVGVTIGRAPETMKRWIKNGMFTPRFWRRLPGEGNYEWLYDVSDVRKLTELRDTIRPGRKMW
jgi:hypothetical protein